MRKSKLILIISSVGLVIVLVFLGIYNFVFKKDSSPKTPATEKTSENTPESSEKQNDPKLMVLIDNPIVGPAISQNGEGLKYYQTPAGKAYELNLSNRTSQAISSNELISLNSIVWSPEKTKAIAKTDSGYFYHNLISKEIKDLGSSMKFVTWNNNGDKIFYVFQKEGQKTAELSIADPDGSNWKKVADLPHSEFSLSSIPGSSDIAFWSSPNSYYETSLKTIPSIGGEEKVLFTGKFGADYLFSPDGKTVLMSHSEKQNGTRIQLATINQNGGEYQNLNLATFVSKCVWSTDSKTIFFALPGQIPANSTLPEEYDEENFFTADTFWKLDIQTGKSERLLELSDINEKVDAQDLFLSNDESQLFFINRINNKLYKIELN